jgi:hypothetical protein
MGGLFHAAMGMASSGTQQNNKQPLHVNPTACELLQSLLG